MKNNQHKTIQILLIMLIVLTGFLVFEKFNKNKSKNKMNIPTNMPEQHEPLGTVTEKLNATIKVAPKENIIKKEVNLNVPFISQAPFGDWGMPYQEACEEASIIMVKHYLSNETLDANHADKEILEMVEWEKQNNYKEDINAKETLEVAGKFYNVTGKVFYDDEVTFDKIKELLSKGHPIIIPAAGRILANPHYTGEGPAYHMIVIKGYNDTHFITNDPGTQFGADYKYSYETVYNAIHDWTGSKGTITNGRKSMLILFKKDN